MNRMKMLSLGIAAVMSASMLTACGEKTYSAKECFKPYVSGCNGYGTFHMADNNEYVNNIMEECLPEDATEMEEWGLYALLGSMEWDADKTEDLSNGDKVNIKISLDEESLAARKIKFTNTEFTYTVEGLEEPVNVDLFSDVNVTFEGTGPKIKASVEYTGNDEIIKSCVKYYLDESSGLSNGDVVTVKASYNENTLFNYNYFVVSEDTKEFAVSGMDEYLREEADLSDLDEKMLAYVHNLQDTSESYGIGAETQGRGFFSNGGFDEYRILDATITPYRTYLLYNSASNNPNIYVTFYKFNYDLESVKEQEKCTSNDIYCCVYLKNILKDKDGNLIYNDENIGYEWFGVSWFSNYIGADFNTVYNAFVDYGYEAVAEKDLA